MNQVGGHSSLANEPMQHKMLNYFNGLKLGEMGIITTIVQNPVFAESKGIIGGLIRLNISKKSCFFLASSCKEPFQLHDFVKVDYHHIRSVETGKLAPVDCIAAFVSESDDQNNLPLARLLWNSTLTLAKMSLMNNSFTDICCSFGIVTINNPLAIAIRNLVIFDHLESMINQDTGLMKCRMEGQEKLVTCYFELRDINASSLKEVKSLTQFLENAHGSLGLCKVTPSTNVSIPYMIDSFTILGDLPPYLMHFRQIKFKTSEELPSERALRFERAAKGSISWGHSVAETPRGLPPVPNQQQTDSSFNFGKQGSYHANIAQIASPELTTQEPVNELSQRKLHTPQNSQHIPQRENALTHPQVQQKVTSNEELEVQVLEIITHVEDYFTPRSPQCSPPRENSSGVPQDPERVKPTFIPKNLIKVPAKEALNDKIAETSTLDDSSTPFSVLPGSDLFLGIEHFHERLIKFLSSNQLTASDLISRCTLEDWASKIPNLNRKKRKTLGQLKHHLMMINGTKSIPKRRKALDDFKRFINY